VNNGDTTAQVAPPKKPSPRRTPPPPRETPPDISSNGKPEPSIKEILAYPVLTPDEVATLYRVSPETVMKMASDGELPALRMKQHTRFLRVDVLRHIRDMRAGVRQQ
jgi:excisionase family DNA binding protein